MPGFGTWYGSRIQGCDLFDIEEGRVSAGEMMADLARKYACEMWYWQGYGDDIPLLSTDGQGERRSSRDRIDQDSYVETAWISAPSGVLSSQVVHSRFNPAHAVSGLIKAPDRDWPVYRQYAGDRWEWGDTTSLTDVPEDALSLGITSLGLALPVDFWKDLRCDTAAAAIDLVEDSSVLGEALEWHLHYSMQRLASRLSVQPPPDMIHLQGSSSSLSVISPGIYERCNLDFVNRACDLAHEKRVPVQIHHCGKSARLVEMLCEKTSVDIIHPLEPPPGGDVNLARVKKRFGDRVILMGNLNTYQLMMFGTPAEVRQAARKCIDDAAEGGRFILTTGDQIGRDTPEANVMAMVEAAREYGLY